MFTEEQKKAFTEPECEIQKFAVEDIMTTSSTVEGEDWELPEF